VGVGISGGAFCGFFMGDSGFMAEVFTYTFYPFEGAII
jgi:hypothetical protein